MAPTHPPRILQIGLGRFGREHLKTWQALAAEGFMSLAGAVVAREQSREALSRLHDIPIFRGIETAPAEAFDAVDIVTPAKTHYDLVRKLIRSADVLVEKPLAATSTEAAALASLARHSSRLLAVGHILRFHPVVLRLRDIVAGIPRAPVVIFGSMINPLATRAPDTEPGLELLHWFDVIDFLFGAAPDSATAARQGAVDIFSLRYPGPMNAVLKLGWAGQSRVRSLELIYRDRSILADLIDHTIVLEGGGAMRKLVFPQAHQALEAELRAFALAVSRRTRPPVDAETGARIVDIAVRAAPRRLTRKPKVAVIGGGIFGATCAAELGRFCEVSLFERHGKLCEEASTLNQWRYHHGFHYPRSPEMIREIQESRQEFEAVYGSAIVPDVASYYCTVSSARVIGRERYLHICRSMGLPFTEELPPDGVLDASQVDLCLRTPESVFDAERLRTIMHNRLASNPDITVALGHEVADGELMADGRKRLVSRANDGRHDDAFDYVVNASYANRNLLAKLFGFPAKPLRFDLLELLVLEIPIPQVSVTILDGPFTSLVGMGATGRFTLSHIQHSVLASATPQDGLPVVWTDIASNRENLLNAASRYLPILKRARLVASRYGTRVVHALPEDIDGRPTVVTDHGFGCWSILGGKINTSVTNARQIADQIAVQQGIEGTTRLPQAWPAGADDAEEWRDRSPTGARRR